MAAHCILVFATGNADSSSKLSSALKSKLSAGTSSGTRTLLSAAPLAAQEEYSLTILPSTSADLDALIERVEEAGGTVEQIVGQKDGFPRLRVKGTADAIWEIADQDETKWIETYDRPRFFNNYAQKSDCMNFEVVRDETHGLSGDGQIITTSDTGIDTGDLSTMHADLRTNVIGFHANDFWYYGRHYYCSTNDVSGHGTHTAGSIVGDGTLSNGEIKGAAPGALLWAWGCECEGGVWVPDDLTDLFLATDYLDTTNAYIHSASWGGTLNVYNTTSQALDEWCWNHPDFLPVFAAGNDGTNDTIHTICCQAAAKNVLAVGAVGTTRNSSYGPNSRADFSSMGPMPDGRTKPDICGAGTYILSTRSTKSTKTGWGTYSANTNYLYNGGTSMATPLVAGSMALIREWLVKERGFDDENNKPSASLMKAIITGGAKRLDISAEDGICKANNTTGWGRADIGNSLYPTNGAVIALHDRIPYMNGTTTKVAELTITNSVPLDIQLCYIDYPAEPSAAETKSLVIDLDLVVSNETQGVVYAPRDRLNNLESVQLESPEIGDVLAVYIEGVDVDYDSTEGGAAAVYVRGAFTEEAVEYEGVTLTIQYEGPENTLLSEGFSPSIGEHKYIKGMSLEIAAPEYIIQTNEYGYAAKYKLEGETNKVVALNEDTSFTWKYADLPSYYVLWYNYCFYEVGSNSAGSYYLFDIDGYLQNYYYDYGEWMPAGEAATVHVMDEEYDGLNITTIGYYYKNHSHGSWHQDTTTVRNFKLGGVSAGVMGEETFYQFSNTGILPKSFTIEMDGPKDIWFNYWPETFKTNDVPYWWYMQKLYGTAKDDPTNEGYTKMAGDPDGDGFDNEYEYNEDTEPANAESFPFRFLSMSKFVGSTNGTFTVIGKKSLTDPTWTDLSNDLKPSPLATGSVTNSISRPTGGTYNYFRIRWEK